MSPPSTDPRAILAELVARPSVSPESDPKGEHRGGEAAVGQYVADFLRAAGAEVQMREVSPGRPNVVGTFAPAGPAVATVALVPHLDTVGVGGMIVPPFELTRRGGRLYGRGACDTKGPMAALLAAIAMWRRTPAAGRSRIRWIVAATVDEEAGGLGAQALVREGFKADFAIALEPTSLRVVHANKGVLRVWLEMQGRAAHGATPWRGRNAINALLPLLRGVEAQLAPQLARKVHPLLGPATVNLGVIEGGQEVNVVPAFCRAGLDIRTHPVCDAEWVLARLQRLRQRVAPAAQLRVFRDGPAYVTPRTHPWAQALRRCARGWDTAHWFCDANRFAAAGIPSVAFGPGNIAQAHTRDEYISERELTAGTRAFLRLLSQEPPTG